MTAKTQLARNASLLSQAVRKAHELTDNNDHNGAILVIAQYIARTRIVEFVTGLESPISDLIKQIKAVGTLADRYGHMPQSLMDTREAIRGELNRKLTAEEYQAFHAAT